MKSGQNVHRTMLWPRTGYNRCSLSIFHFFFFIVLPLSADPILSLRKNSSRLLSSRCIGNGGWGDTVTLVTPASNGPEGEGGGSKTSSPPNKIASRCPGRLEMPSGLRARHGFFFCTNCTHQGPSCPKNSKLYGNGRRFRFFTLRYSSVRDCHLNINDGPGSGPFPPSIYIHTVSITLAAQ